MKGALFFKKAHFKLIGIYIIYLISSFYFMSINAQESMHQYGQHASQFNVISANVRVALKEDYSKGVGWDNRKELLFNILKNKNPDILCLQEVLRVQNEDFKDNFPHFFSFGYEGPEMDAYTDDDYHGVAKNPILFSKEKFELVSSGTYWLSESPHIGGSKSWNTARARHVNWVRLKDRKSKKEFRVLNTHFDHVSSEAKKNQALMILEEADQYPDSFPQILAGDFNSDITSKPVEILTRSWRDSYAEVNGDTDPGFTVHGFIGDQAKTKKGKVDFIFIKGGFKALESKVIKDNKNGKFPSDHYFIFTGLKLTDK